MSAVESKADLISQNHQVRLLTRMYMEPGVSKFLSVSLLQVSTYTGRVDTAIQRVFPQECSKRGLPPGLYLIDEVVRVTGKLGGFQFSVGVVVGICGRGRHL